MLTSKQRAYLRGLAAKEDTILQIGKDGITENTTAALSDMLRARELVKGRVLENSMLTVREACDTLAARCRAEQAASSCSISVTSKNPLSNCPRRRRGNEGRVLWRELQPAAPRACQGLPPGLREVAAGQAAGDTGGDAATQAAAGGEP